MELMDIYRNVIMKQLEGSCVWKNKRTAPLFPLQCVRNVDKLAFLLNQLSVVGVKQV